MGTLIGRSTHSSSRRILKIISDAARKNTVCSSSGTSVVSTLLGRAEENRVSERRESMVASEVGAHEASSDGFGSGKVPLGGKSPLASHESSGQTVVRAETVEASHGAQKISNSFAPQTPAMSTETDDVDGDHVLDDSFDLDDDGEDLDLTAEMERLGLDENDTDGDGSEHGDGSERDDTHGGSFDDDSVGDASAVMEQEEAETRRRVDAEFEMNLRRAELKHVELELRLVASEETVRSARTALALAESEREQIQSSAHLAWEEVGEVEVEIAEENARRDTEDAVKHKAKRQARAVVDADELRKKGNEAYRNGECADAEVAYKSAINALESCGIELVEPSHLTLRTNRAAALMALGKMREAHVECEAVLRINPENIRALSRAGNCCVKLGNLVAAQSHVDSILNAPSATPEDINAASMQHQKILVASVERDRLVGNDAYRRGDYRGALTWYDAALEAAKDVIDTRAGDAEYTDVLLDVKVGLHTNRAAAHLMRGAPLAAAEDCCAALRLDSGHTKAQVRLARCLLQLGDFAEARQEATDVAERAGGELQSKSEARGVLEDIAAVERASRDAGESLKLAESKLQQAENQPDGQQWDDDFDIQGTASEALRAVDAAVALAPAVPDLITLKAEALRFLDRREEALALLKGKKCVNARRACVEIRLHFDAGNLGACLESAAEIKDVLDAIPEYAAKRLRGKENGGDGETAKNAAYPGQDAGDGDDDINDDLKTVPDPEGLLLLLEKAAKIGECKDAGREAFKSGEHRDALATYAEALRMSSGTSALEGLFLSNMCACEQALGQYADALSSAGTAVGVAPKFIKAHSRLATIYVELSMFDDASAAYASMLELPLEHAEAATTRAAAAAARRKAKQAHPVDWIKLLGVTPNASAGEMKKTYRQLALAHHPDKANKQGASAGVAKARSAISSKLFKHIGEANRVLCDATERMRWENAKSKADRAARTASYATQSRQTGSSHFDPYKRAGGSSYYADFEEEAFSYDDYAYSEFYDDYQS